MADFKSVVTKLNGDNYSVWAKKMEFMLRREKLWDVVKKKGDSTEKADSDWDDRDEKAHATIGLCIEDNQLVHLGNSTSAHDAWEKLKHHHQKSTLSNIVFLYKQLFRLHLEEGGNMDDHISELLTHINKLTALSEVLSDKLQASLLLSSLPESYSALVNSLECRDEKDFTLDFVKGRVLDEYGRRKEKSTASSETALKVSGKVNSGCFFCNAPGHIKKNCDRYKAWKKKKHAKEQEKCGMANSESASLLF